MQMFVWDNVQFNNGKSLSLSPKQANKSFYMIVIIHLFDFLLLWFYEKVARILSFQNDFSCLSSILTD